MIFDDISVDGPLFLRLANLFSDVEGTCLLYSGGDHPASKKSFLSLFPFDYIIIKGKKQWRWKNGDPESRQQLEYENPWDALKELIAFRKGSSGIPEWVGYLGYEMGAYADKEKEIPFTPNSLPDAYFQRCAVTIVLDHQTMCCSVYISDQATYFLNENEKQWVEKLYERSFWESLALHLPFVQAFHGDFSLAKPLEIRHHYCAKVEEAKKWVRSGDIYQMNLSQQLILSGKSSSFPLFNCLSNLNPAPFSAYLKTKEFALVSSSPERFLKKQEDLLETRPIKGTAPRGASPDEDLRLREGLINSTKDRAELLMITDLMRNDLGKVSLPGSVITQKLWDCEAYTNVFHLVSILQSKLAPHWEPIDVVRHCFPGGSITGCPKLRAMELIHDLEKRSRGIYTGSIGYFTSEGDFDFNIAIRTMLVTENQIDIQLGGAIVADSDAEKEYEETLHKGKSLFSALGINSKVLEMTR